MEVILSNNNNKLLYPSSSLLAIDKALGDSVQTLGDWVKASAGSKRNTMISISKTMITISKTMITIGVSGISIATISAISSITIESIRISISISRPLANKVVMRHNNSLGHSIKSLGDGV